MDVEGTGTPSLLNRVQSIHLGFFGPWGRRGFQCRLCLGKIQMSSLLGKIQMSSLLEIFTGGVRIRTEQFFLQGGGGEDFFLGPSIFFLQEGRGKEKIFFGLRFFLQGGGRRGRTRKKDQMPKGAFFPSPRASLFPQRHRDWVSRLTEGTPGGLVGKKSRFGAWSFFWGRGGAR